MTSTTGAAGHPDVDEISALVEGLLSPAETEDIHRHLADCPDCSDVYASLEEVRALLGELSAPIPMPDDVAERIDAALSAEALLAAAPSPPPSLAHVSRETSSADDSKTSGSRPGGHPRGSTGPGRTGHTRSRNRRRTITLGAVFTVALLGLGSFLLQSMNSGDGGGPSDAYGVRPSDARHTFSSRNLEEQVTTLLKEEPAPVKTEGDSEPVTPTPTPSLDLGPKDTPPKTATPLQRTEIAVAIPDCIRKGIGRPEAPIAAEQGVFEGTEAYLVVLPHATDPSKISAYVVDADCTQPPVSPVGAILMARSYARH
ncbi:hypothetical protein GCM10018793_03910 [Streptomyces sulfonofaciens]|uniref:Putative zinc-finger domain-containing protein n=1 Tax=Streptomyces sulfonofaciens TaxID=68272 RepID=A0A919FPU7_9ACTN|nr:zf-HC2 domain-containing protein [Streptomyces sulfonofaciens]GHH70217.1 hypothetical protein GCM10018793_03910 [Streptomyces sulfonofaciens]